MNISNVSAVSAIYTGYNAGGFGSGGSTSSIKIADGSTITTQRGSFGDVVSVTTTAPATPSPVPQATESTVDVVA